MKKPNEQLPLSPEQRLSTVKDEVNEWKATRSVGDTTRGIGGMQQPTHPRLHVRDGRDAHVVFEAVRLGHLRPVVRRLNEMERSTYVHSGAIFVWIESDDDVGLKRWTDGRVWGQSRMREPYLFYDEKLPYDNHGLSRKLNRAPTSRFVDRVPKAGLSSSSLSHQEQSTNHHKGLVKQAYSAWVTPNPYARPQKWHLTAYFTYVDLPHLPTTDQDELLATIALPEGVYKSGKARSREDEEAFGLRMSLPLDNSPPSYPNSAPPSYSSPALPSYSDPDPPSRSSQIQMLNSKHVR
ncbi:hypothetical protein H1R20_g2613, partial [Candolleomyces eurysporus]